MKVKTAELEGPALDWAVAKCVRADADMKEALGRFFADGWPFEPSTAWAHAGPIIDREQISLSAPNDGLVVRFLKGGKPAWAAFTRGRHDVRVGITPLVAAMRCFVASRLGDEVEVPDELMAQVETPNEPSPRDDQRPRARM